MSGVVEYGNDHKTRKTIVVRSKEDPNLFVEYIIPRDKQLVVYPGDYIEKGESLTDGPINPHDILRTKGVAALAAYMINEVQEVYKLQGVNINDKHIEVVVRQMLQKVEVMDSGDSMCVAGIQLDKLEAMETNRGLESEGKQPMQYRSVLQSITRASLQTQSFISSASFQETTKILTEAALMCKEDRLEGLKENIIVGRLIPAGTGFMLRQYKDKIVP